MAAATAFSVHNSSLNSPLLFAPSVSFNPLLNPKISTVFSSSASKTQHLKLKHSPRGPRASAEGVPSELIEDSKFVPLNADDLIYGPPAILLLGFEVEEAGKMQEFLRQLGGEFLKVIYCTEDMIMRTLEEAMTTSQPNLEEIKIMKPLPRICFLSGLSGEEMMVFIDSFPESGLEDAVFAALVPNSANKLLTDLIEEIMEDYKMLAAKAKEKEDV